MIAKLTIETNQSVGFVTLEVGGNVRSRSEFYADPAHTDLCAVRTAIDFFRALYRETAEASDGQRPIDMLRRLHDAVAAEMSYQLKHEDRLQREVESAKRFLDDTRPKV